MTEQSGLIHLYSGDGKGKTTTAMGLCLRALGAGKRVIIVQFLKSTPTAEIPLLEQLGATVFRGQSCDKFVFQMTEEERAQNRARQMEHLVAARNVACDVLLLDEGCAALALGQVDDAMMKDTILNRPSHCEVIVTGRDPAPWLVDAAHYHTEMKLHRHPYELGVSARNGIEF